MFEATATTFERWTDRAEQSVRSTLQDWHARAATFLNQVRQTRAIVAWAPEKSPASTVVALERTTIMNGRDIAEVHGTAAIKIDAAEYAYTMMVAELRNVMKSAPYGSPSTAASGFTRIATAPEAVAQAA